jgi:hypothetical protein
VVLLLRPRRMASSYRRIRGSRVVNTAWGPLVETPGTGGTGPVVIPAASGWGVLARLPTATLPLSVPKPDAGQEATRQEAGFAHKGAEAPSCERPAGVKAQAKSVLQNPHVPWCSERGSVQHRWAIERTLDWLNRFRR